MQFASMESTVVTASSAYCSLSGFTLVRFSPFTRALFWEADETESLSLLVLGDRHTRSTKSVTRRSWWRCCLGATRSA
jgi:hypothetical protein